MKPGFYGISSSRRVCPNAITLDPFGATPLNRNVILIYIIINIKFILLDPSWVTRTHAKGPAL